MIWCRGTSGDASGTQRRASHLHQQLVYLWPVEFLPLVLFAPDDSHSVTFRQSAPSGVLNLKTSA